MTREEAIRIIESNCSCSGSKLREACAIFIPELRESEDEKIRKKLIQFLTDIKSISESGRTSWAVRKEDAEMCATFLAYLEKQKEQKLISFNEPYNPDDYEVVMEGNATSLKRKEQKPIDDGTREKIISRAKSEKQVVLISESSGKAEIGWDTHSLEDTKKLLEHGIAFVNKQLGTKPAEWSEEDKNMWTHLNGYLNGFSCSEYAIKQMADWFYELPNRFNLQPKQEWSEEDEAMLDSVIRIITQIDDLAHEPTFAGPKWTHPYTKEIAWLKSLRPQPKQEVTDEEIEEMVKRRSRSTGTLKSEMDFYRNGIKDAIKRFDLRPSWKPSGELLDALHTVAYIPEMEFYGGLKYKLRELYEHLINEL